MITLKKYCDAHVHIDRFGVENHGKARAMLDLLRDKGVSHISVLSYMPGCDVVTNLNTLWWKNNYTDVTIHAFGCFHEDDFYKNVPYETQYEKMIELGFDGIKFIQMKPDRRKPLGKGINHPSYDKAFSMMEADGTPVTIHSGDPQDNWDITKVSEYGLKHGWFYGDGTFPSAEDLYRENFEMLDRHPNLNVTFAHFFFLSEDMERVRRLFEKYPNLKLDLAPGGEMFLGFSKDIDAWHDFFEEYSDRIIFGTDCADIKAVESNTALTDSVREVLYHDRSVYTMPIYGGYTVKGLELSSEAFEKICYSNYIRFAGEGVKPFDGELFKKSAEKMYCDLKDLPQYEKSAAWLKSLI